MWYDGACVRVDPDYGVLMSGHKTHSNRVRKQVICHEGIEGFGRDKTFQAAPVTAPINDTGNHIEWGFEDFRVYLLRGYRCFAFVSLVSSVVRQCPWWFDSLQNA